MIYDIIDVIKILKFYIHINNSHVASSFNFVFALVIILHCYISVNWNLKRTGNFNMGRPEFRGRSGGSGGFIFIRYSA